MQIKIECALGKWTLFFSSPENSSISLFIGDRDDCRRSSNKNTTKLVSFCISFNIIKEIANWKNQIAAPLVWLIEHNIKTKWNPFRYKCIIKEQTTVLDLFSDEIWFQFRNSTCNSINRNGTSKSFEIPEISSV